MLDSFADPRGNGFEMTHKDFGNLFGSKVVKHGNKIVSCAPREQWKDKIQNDRDHASGLYSRYTSNMGKCAHINNLST